MASHAAVLQNLSLIPPSSHSTFFPVIQSRISYVSHFDSVVLKAYLPIHHPQTSPGERLEAESSAGDNKSDNEKDKKKKTKKELRPNFYHQTLKKWSVKISSQRTKLPWQEQQVERGEKVVHGSVAGGLPVEPLNNRTSVVFLDGRTKSGSARLDLEVHSSDHLVKLPKSSNLARPKDSQHDVVENNSQTEDNRFKLGMPLSSAPRPQPAESKRSSLAHSKLFLARQPDLTDSTNEESPSYSRRTISSSIRMGVELQKQELGDVFLPTVIAETTKSQFYVDAASTVPSQAFKCDAQRPKSRVSAKIEKLEETMDHCNQEDARSYVGSYHENVPTNSLFDSDNSSGSSSFPWGDGDGVSKIDPLRRRSNTDMAERTIPEPELRRLRNEAMRLKERLRVGPAGVTEAVVENILQKWKEVEVVKLYIEGPPSLNMKRTNDILETKTGGIAIWRSGSSIVLYRGLNYKLTCARSFSRISETTSSMDGSAYSNYSVVTKGTIKVLEQSAADIELSSARTFEVSSDASHIDSILNQLGPRYTDWSGRDPLPVDADLLPGMVPGYKPPFRLLPYKTKRSLTNRQMTFLRRIARSMAPHFALGRNKQLQGLANGMVKLWETSAIAKIAIKRGVQNTSNERMAEEIKELTGGTLLSRNKEYIVFYRGNDFLTPCIRDTLVEREKLAIVQQDAEEEARSRASGLISSNSKAVKGPFVAGTLAETLKAYNHWANQPSSEDRQRMRRDLALSQQESLVRYLERKLSFAIAKVRNAEKALAKVQETLRPANLPTDLETVTDEERALFRKIGLKMRSHLPLGRRGVFDGTIQNIHLNWKHMELAKIIVNEKSFAQVKHIAISLEAESGGVLISVDKTTKGYVIILYRGKNYQRPHILRPKNLLSKREALTRSIELQRREALNHHIANLNEKVQILKSKLAQMELDREASSEVTHDEVADAFSYNDVEEECKETRLTTYSFSNEGDDTDYPNRLQF
ncbi:CRM-domain containing factor CFM3, chloroplastic/mitochondrial [Dendrobium catenatum]|uniref:Chloroplastic group IIA intron splicing facilitator CRS1, chloroplastic n=1 Tax=Dendrobium catenatum TaxID=906689 RepID=A0A2I0X2B6_9ASPA|nr:CRM-domain containing factor CFM3, chloroplastic/mitochondrial [Dendrobium catenatum]PKU82037.1 Chloroplastic group IIA intron splicing facilitator CRS1, chloroplastic [Dendrobium catenatum]